MRGNEVHENKRRNALIRKQRKRRDDRGFLRQSREREKEDGERPPVAQVFREPPEGEGRRSDVQMSQRTLRKPHRVNSGQRGRGNGYAGVGNLARQPEDAHESEGGDQQHGRARDRRREPGELPPERQPSHHQRRMPAADRRVRNEVALEP